MNTILFDLDGTLLPMDMKEFTDTYSMLLENRLNSVGYENAKDILDAVSRGMDATVQNDGLVTNEESFWRAFAKRLADPDGRLDRKYSRKLEKEIMRFYKEDFSYLRYVTRPTEVVTETIDILKEKGYQMVLAQNPLWPERATLTQLSWTGLNPNDFILITTYENSCYAKPSLNYYRHLMKTLDKDPEDCMMARKLGIDVFLIDEYLVNENQEDTFDLKKGNWKLFKEYVSALPTLN